VNAKKIDYEIIKRFVLLPLVILINITLLVAGYFYDYHSKQVNRQPANPITVKQSTLKHNFSTSGGLIKQTRAITTEIMTEMDDGDYVLPQFSPDGRYLAYSKVLVEKAENGANFENTAVLLYDTVLHDVKTLLAADKAKNFAVNQSFVIELNWIGRQKLQVALGDGDLGATYLTFDISSGKALKTEYHNGDEGTLPFKGAEKKAFDRAIGLFPQLDRGVLENVLRNSHLILPGKGIIYQKNFEGEDNHIWLLDFITKTKVCLLKMPLRCNYAIKGGFCFGADLIFLLDYARDSVARMYRYRHGKVELIQEFIKPEYQSLIVKNHSPKGVFFLVRLARVYEQSQNPFYYYDGQKLTEIRDCNQLCDVAVDCNGAKIAFCYWRDHQRRIIVKKVDF
jgi:hypothetical protein